MPFQRRALEAGRRFSVRAVVSVVLTIPSLWLFSPAAGAAEPARVRVADLLEPRVADVVDAADVRPHIEYLASPELRGRGGDDARQAAEYIRRHFERIKLKPLFAGGSYFQEIPGSPGPDGRPVLSGRNVGALLEGSDPKLRNEIIIISAHFDHLGTVNGQMYRGADDNASGVSMLLEVARQFADSTKPPRRSIAFVGFDLEERMLWGSRWFAAHPPWPLEQVKLFVTADMIGRSLGDLPLPTVFVLGSEHAPLLKETLDRVGTPENLEVARLGIDLIGTRSDYGPFMAREVPFLFFSTGQHPDYHTPRDVPERIDYEKVAKVSSLIFALTTDVANAHDVPVWTNDVQPNLDEARALHRISNLLLKAEEKRPLSSMQRMIVTQAQNKAAQVLERGSMTADERTWLTRLSKLMLLSVF